jgi:hypothetical protein
MSKSQTVSPSQPSTSPPEIPEHSVVTDNHLVPVFEAIKNFETMECYRLGAAILQDLGVGEPSIFRDVEPPVFGESIRAGIKPTQYWFDVANDLSRFQKDPRMLAVALLRISCVRLVGSS